MADRRAVRMNSTSPGSGSPCPSGSSTRPAGMRLRANTTTPSPASAAARRPLRLPLVQPIRHCFPLRCNTSSARARVMLGAG